MQDGSVTQQAAVSFKVEMDPEVPEQAAFVQFLEEFDERVKVLLMENYAKVTRAKDESADDDQKKLAISFQFKYPTVKRPEDQNGNPRKPGAKMRIMSRAAKDGGAKPDIKDTTNWLVDVFGFNDEGEMGPVNASTLMQRGLTAKIMFELRVTNSNQGYTTGLTARSVTVLDHSSGNDEVLKAVWAEDEDIQEFKKRKLEAKALSPPAVASPPAAASPPVVPPPVHEASGDDEY